MKRRILALLLSVFAIFAFSFGLSACAGGADGKDGKDGKDGINGSDGKDGKDGKDGAGVADAYIDSDGNLILVLTDGKEINSGKVREGNFKYSEIEKGGQVSGYEVTGFNAEYTDSAVIPSVHDGKPVLSIGKDAFYECENLTGVIIPDSVVTVGVQAFYNCENLKSVTIGNGVESIGELAFADCYALENVNLGNNLKTIGEYAFSQCYALKEADIPSSVETIGECAFVECANITAVTLREGLKTIGDCAFGGCRRITSFVMPDSVTSIGWGAVMFDAGGGFEPGDSTNNLTELVISNSVTVIPDYAFSKSNIFNVKIGSAVETIKYSSFFGCAMLESAVIPKSVKRIESYAFYRCSALQTVYYEGTEEEWNNITIGRNGNDISNAEKYYFSSVKPYEEGNFWHYSGGVPVKW